jgi:hypothetical protein
VLIQVNLAGAWLVSTRGVGNLNVTNPSAIAGNSCTDIVAVHRKVVQVSQEADISRAGCGLYALDHPYCVSCSPNWIPGRTAHRFH